METKLDAKKIFRQCGTCSQTFAHLLNREFGYPKEMEEVALDPLAGGILNSGHQCGMLWGATLGAGAEAYRRHEDIEQATAVAVTASQVIVESFVNRTSTLNCREITGYKLNTILGMVGLMYQTLRKGMNNSPCFNLAEDWAPEAIQSATDAMNAGPIELTQSPISCASEVVKKMGATEEEVAMVAGFAGGLGLSGHACGALAAAIWLKTLHWCKKHPGKRPSLFRNKAAKNLIAVFQETTNGETQCSQICGKKFDSINEHSEYIYNGGCQRIIDVLGQS